MKRSLWVGVVAAIGLTIGSGLLHGRLSQRWTGGEAMRAAAARIEALPTRIGAWQFCEEFTLEPLAIELLDCQGYVHRGYRNEETGDYLKLALMVGPGAKMSIHVPEVCYEARNFTLLGDRVRHTIQHDDGSSDELWGVKFQINDVSQQKLGVLYGWSNGGVWQAPDIPRWSVAGNPVLYKLQVSYGLNPSAKAVDGNDIVIESFVESLLITLREM